MASATRATAKPEVSLSGAPAKEPDWLRPRVPSATESPGWPEARPCAPGMMPGSHRPGSHRPGSHRPGSHRPALAPPRLALPGMALPGMALGEVPATPAPSPRAEA